MGYIGFSAVLVINRVLILAILGIDFCVLVLNLEEATSLSCPPPSIRALPPSPPFNACDAR